MLSIRRSSILHSEHRQTWLTCLTPGDIEQRGPVGTGAGRRRGQTQAPGQDVTTAQLTIVSDASFGMFIGVIYLSEDIKIFVADSGI